MDDKEPIHTWFELTYASYLVLPRSILQSTPNEWQQRFVKCLEELEDLFGNVPRKGTYIVSLKSNDGRRDIALCIIEHRLGSVPVGEVEGR